MDSTRSFLFTIFALGLFVVSGMPFLSNEMAYSVQSKNPTTNQVAEGNYHGTVDLSKVTGEQIVGLVPFALSGEFVLVVDGLTINSTTDISTINLSGVPGLMYTIALTRDANGNVASITATH